MKTENKYTKGAAESATLEPTLKINFRSFDLLSGKAMLFQSYEKCVYSQNSLAFEENELVFFIGDCRGDENVNLVTIFGKLDRFRGIDKRFSIIKRCNLGKHWYS